MLHVYILGITSREEVRRHLTVAARLYTLRICIVPISCAYMLEA